MTAALERHWGEPMGLRVRRVERAGQHLRREVVLIGQVRGIPAEIGFIDIRLDALAPHLADRVLAGKRPFGALLAEAGVWFRSRPVRFFQALAGDGLAEALSVPPCTVLHGRETVLSDREGRHLARAVEILAPPPD